MESNESLPSWKLQDAKARFSEVFARSLAEGPQRVTRHGKEAVIIVSEEDWRMRVPLPSATEAKPSLADFLLNSPLLGSNLKVVRNEAWERDVIL